MGKRLELLDIVQRNQSDAWLIAMHFFKDRLTDNETKRELALVAAKLVREVEALYDPKRAKR